MTFFAVLGVLGIVVIRGSPFYIRFFFFEDYPMITIQDFAQTELKIARILSVDDHPAADKLYVLRVDIGEENPRIIVAGIKGHYTPEELEGRLVVVVANLEPAKLRGIQSNGMLLAASDGEQVVLLAPDKDLAPGSSVG